MRDRNRALGPWVSAALTLLVTGPATAAEGAGAAGGSDPRSVIVRAISQAPDIPQQAATLVRLAWPSDGQGEPRVQTMARADLIDYGEYALRPLRDAIKSLDPLWHADVVATFVEASRTVTAGQPADLLPGLEEAIWFGSPYAKRLAMREISRYKFPPVVLPIIDAIEETPALALTGIRVLGQLGDARARFFLARVLAQGTPAVQFEAAAALAQLDEPGLLALRQAARSDSRGEREAAFAAMLVAARPEDADLFHRYPLQHPDDDPSLLQKVQRRGAELEALLEQQRDDAAASSDTGEDDQP